MLSAVVSAVWSSWVAAAEESSPTLVACASEDRRLTHSLEIDPLSVDIMGRMNRRGYRCLCRCSTSLLPAAILIGSSLVLGCFAFLTEKMATAALLPLCSRTVQRSGVARLRVRSQFFSHHGNSAPSQLKRALRAPLCACRQLQLSTPQSAATTRSLPHDFKLVYDGPLKQAVKAIKIFSISTSVCVLLGTPVLVVLGNPGVPVVGRVAISSVVVLLGLTTTLILHWFTKSYVTRMWHSRDKDQLVVHTLSLLARTKQKEFAVSEAGPPGNVASFATFKAGGERFFLHTEVFEDKNLLSRILGAYAEFEKLHTSSQQDPPMT